MSTHPPLVVFLETATVEAAFRDIASPHQRRAHATTPQSEVVARLAGTEVAVLNKLRLGAAEIAALPDLRMIAVTATGTDNLDLDACRARGIVVSNVRGYAVHSVPEHTFALILALRRRLFDYVSDVRAGRWQHAAGFCLFGHPIDSLHGAVLGLVGGGSLGGEVARLAEAFGMRVLRAEHRGRGEARPGYTPFAEVLAAADVLSLHCPLNEDTRNLIGVPELAGMKPSAVLINTARGGLVDEHALADALRRGLIAGAAVDVLSAEPPRDGNPLLAEDIPNLLVTPHVAWASREAMEALAEQVVANIEGFLVGTPRNRVV